MFLFKLLYVFTLLTLSFPIFAVDQSVYWEITSPSGKTHFLFGTIHTDDNRVSEFHPEVLRGLKASNTFIMETDEIQDRSILLVKNAFYEKYLDEGDFDRIKDLAYFHTMPLESALQMKPWLLAIIFNSPRPITPFNQDNLLKRKAEDLFMVVQGLETVSEHFSVLDAFELSDQMTLLTTVLKRSEDIKLKDYEALVNAYLTFDPEVILQTDESITSKLVSNEMWKEMQEKLIQARNQLFFERILELENGNNLFIAVGASHLGGSNGLLNLFKAGGYQIKPLPPLAQ
ncbi:MAG: TraB/GumN family protein [Nitrosomonadales bacterium]|nr:TraB/GumN family protein [Nitrosomonadales bacterium]